MTSPNLPGHARSTGAALVPGGNDSLILFGMPLLWPNAWLAFVSMCAVVLLSLWGLGRLRARLKLRSGKAGGGGG